jgi:tetratricopeptide (TPR) repeat protein
MRKLLFICLAIPLLCFWGCEKKLEIVPNFVAVESTALSTTESIDAAISYAYFLLHSNIGTHMTLWTELMSDELFYKGTLNNYLNYYNRNLSAAAEEQSSATDPRGVNNIKQREMYNCVNFASLVLRATRNDVAKDDPTFAANKDRIMAECYFLRGVANFELLRFFSKPWGASADNSHLGIIINPEPVDDRVSQIKARSTVAEVYAFILDDLTKAEALMPERYNPSLHPSGYNGRAYKDAVLGYLVKVYFQQQNYPKAKEMIDKLIGAAPGSVSRHPLDADVLQTFTSTGPNEITPEIIYQSTASVAGIGLNGFWFNSNTALYTRPTNNPANVNGLASNAFKQNARFYGTDQRYARLFSLMTTGAIMPIKYTSKDNANIPLIRSAEMLLDRAEIYALDNNVSSGVRDCNVVRVRALLPPLPESISQAALLDSVRIERIRELCFEGDRFWNLKRLKLPLPVGDRTAAALLPWDGLETVFKYFLAEQDKNPLLVNNY